MAAQHMLALGQHGQHASWAARITAAAAPSACLTPKKGASGAVAACLSCSAMVTVQLATEQQRVMRLLGTLSRSVPGPAERVAQAPRPCWLL